MNLFKLTLGFLILFSNIGCIPDDVLESGMAPIYANPDDFSKIKFEEPRISENHGNVVLYKQYVFINEKNKGIHVIDNYDPLNPIRLGFIYIEGNSIFTVNDGYLYADNSIHLLTIDIKNIYQPKVVSFIANHFGNSFVQEMFPSDYRGKFECANAMHGLVIGWERKTIKNPKCFIN